MTWCLCGGLGDPSQILAWTVSNITQSTICEFGCKGWQCKLVLLPLMKEKILINLCHFHVFSFIDLFSFIYMFIICSLSQVPATREVLGSLPNVFSALCLNARGLHSFVQCQPFERLFKVLLSPDYLPAMRRRRSSDPLGELDRMCCVVEIFLCEERNYFMTDMFCVCL